MISILGKYKKIMKYVEQYIYEHDIYDDNDFSISLNINHCNIIVNSPITNCFQIDKIRIYDILYDDGNERNEFGIVKIVDFLGCGTDVISYGCKDSNNFIFKQHNNELNVKYINNCHGINNIFFKNVFSSTLYLNNIGLHLNVVMINNQHSTNYRLPIIANMSLTYISENGNLYFINFRQILDTLRNIHNDDVQTFIQHILIFVKPIRNFNDQNKKMFQHFCNHIAKNFWPCEDVNLPIAKTKNSSVYLSSLRGNVYIIGESNPSLISFAKSKLYDEYNFQRFNDDKYYERFNMNPYVVFHYCKSIIIFKKFRNTYIKIEHEEYQKVVEQFELVKRMI